MVRIGLVALLACFAIGQPAAHAAVTPAILVNDTNKVPGCVKPDRLMEFIGKRNKSLDPRFQDVARLYQSHGREVGVRWDYAFFQMIVETSSLKYKTGSGRWGDVKPKQNNFAGLGATGGGEPGESFPDVSTGVLAHLHHIRLYSGEPVENPAANRTKLVEDLILPWSRGIGRPVTFTDLTSKWSPTDKGYSDDIESVAKSYRSQFCTKDEEETVEPTTEIMASVEPEKAAETAAADNGDVTGQRSEKTLLETNAAAANLTIPDDGAVSETTVAVATTTAPVTEDVTTTTSMAPGTQLAALALPKKPTKACKVFTASYGGASAVLIEAADAGETVYTALGVHEGKETAQTDAFIAAYAKGGRTIGSYANQDLALTQAFELCPEN